MNLRELTKYHFKLSVIILLVGILLIGIFWQASAGPSAQIPTGSIPTVTGTPAGATAIVLDNEQGLIKRARRSLDRRIRHHRGAC